MKRPVKYFEYGGSALSCLRQVLDRRHSVLPGTRLRKEGKKQKTATEANQGMDRRGGKRATLSPSPVQRVLLLPSPPPLTEAGPRLVNNCSKAYGQL